MKPATVATDLAPARVCCWCSRAHYMTPEDRIRHAAGARVTHGLCEAAGERMTAEIEAECANAKCAGTQ